MRRFEAIIQSETAPHENSFWLINNKLYYFEGGWRPVEGAFDSAENTGLKEIKTLLIGDRKLLDPDGIDFPNLLLRLAEAIASQSPASGEITLDGGLLEILEQGIERNAEFPLVGDKVLFRLDNSAEALENNAKMLAHLEEQLDSYQSTYTSVYIRDTEVNNIPAIYHNAHIYAIVGNKLTVYNVNTNDINLGRIDVLKTVDLTLLPTYIDLELGNTVQIKSYNLEQLQKVSGTQFFVHADYGIGVGSFNSGSGGEVTIQTAGGDRVHYLITEEGECVKQSDRFDHSELFFNLGRIDVTTLPKTVAITDNIEAIKFQKATNLAVEVLNGSSTVDTVSMSQVSVNIGTGQSIYNSPDLIIEDSQDWNYIKATATKTTNGMNIYLETV